jgi:predicted HicB family RNase H-like nuclease
MSPGFGSLCIVLNIVLARNMAEYRGYIAEITKDEVTHLFRGHVIKVKDIVVFEAETLERAKQEFHRSIDVYLEFCRKIGKQPEQSSG